MLRSHNYNAEIVARKVFMQIVFVLIIFNRAERYCCFGVIIDTKPTIHDSTLQYLYIVQLHNYYIVLFSITTGSLIGAT